MEIPVKIKNAWYNKIKIKKRVNDLKEDNLQLFMFTMKEYKRFYRQLPKSKITDYYDDITYVEINTKLMLLRKYGCNKENVYIKDIIDIALEKYPDKESKLKELLEDYLRIEKQQLEYILADGTKLNIYETIEDVMYGMYLHADENRINRLMITEEILRFACVRKYVEQLEEIVFGVYEILKNSMENIKASQEREKATVILLGNNKTNKQEINKSPYWSNLYGKDGILEDLTDLIKDMNYEDAIIINICYTFIEELKKEKISTDILNDLIHSATKNDWGDYSEAKAFYNSIEKPGLSLIVRYNEDYTMAYVRILSNVDNIFIIHDAHVISELYEISLVKEEGKWKIYSMGGHLDSYILKGLKEK